MAILFFTAANVFVILYAPQPILPLLADHFQISDSTAGLIVSVTIFALAISSAILAPLLDRWDRKKVVVLSTVGLIIPSAALYFVDSFPALIIWRLIQGVFVPGIIAVLPAYISEEYSLAVRGKVMGGYVSATVVGGFLGRLMAGPIAENLSWEAVFGVLALFSTLVALLAGRYLPKSQGRSGRDRGGVIEHFKNPALIGTFLIGFMQFFAFIGFFTFLAFYVTQPPFNLGLTYTSYLYATFLFGVVSAFLAGTLSDRLGRRLTMAVGHVCGLAGVLLTLWATLPALVIGASLLALGHFAAQSSATAHVTDIAEKSRGAATSTYQFTYYIGGSLGAWIPGLLWKTAGWPGVVLCLAIALVLALLLNGFLAGRTSREAMN
ncbi:MAG TPA: MFS transporter [Bacillales bacterium]|nr:MFS transporter [Bacillales bacterium]